MKLGIILTPDNRSKAYIQKLVENNIILNSILFMNDNRREKPYSDDIIKISKKNGYFFSPKYAHSVDLSYYRAQIGYVQ